jgi:uncharacterized protein YsxB (DUF464 family)
MTTARLYTQGDGIRAFEVCGHSGYASAGEDIVCSAVSALTQAALLGLTEVLGIEVDYQIDEENGILRSTLVCEPSRESQILLETMKRALQSVQSDYPDYVRVICEKWRGSK